MSHQMKNVFLTCVLLTCVYAQTTYYKINSVSTDMSLTYSPPITTSAYNSYAAGKCMSLDVVETITVAYDFYGNSFKRPIPASVTFLIFNSVKSTTPGVLINSNVFTTQDGVGNIVVVFTVPTYFAAAFKATFNLNYTVNAMKYDSTNNTNVIDFSYNWEAVVDRSVTNVYLPRNNTLVPITTSNIIATPASYVTSMGSSYVSFARDAIPALTPYDIRVVFPAQIPQCPPEYDASKDPAMCYNPGVRRFTTCKEYNDYIALSYGLGFGLGVGIPITFMGLVVLTLVGIKVYFRIKDRY